MGNYRLCRDRVKDSNRLPSGIEEVGGAPQRVVRPLNHASRHDIRRVHQIFRPLVLVGHVVLRAAVATVWATTGGTGQPVLTIETSERGG